MNLTYEVNETVFLFSPTDLFWSIDNVWGEADCFVRNRSFTSTYELPQASSSVVFELIWEPTLRSRGYAAIGKFYPASKTHHA